MNSFDEAAVRGCERGGGVGAAVFKSGEGGGKFVGTAGDFDHEIVTAVLAFDAHDAGDPPDCGVVEEDAFDEDLGEIHQVIVTADVGEFVEEDGFYLSGGEAGE